MQSKAKGKGDKGTMKGEFETYKQEIEQYPELSSLSRLHGTIKQVRGKRDENHEKLELLGAAYRTLKGQVETLKVEQNASNNEATAAIPDAKKDEKKK